MKFVADEGVDLAIVFALRKINYHVIYIAEDFGGIADQKDLDIAIAFTKLS